MKYATIVENNIVELKGRALSDPISELRIAGAWLLVAQAVEAEFQELLNEYSEQRTHDSKAEVVRNSYLPERELQTGLGPVTVKIPKIRSKTGKHVPFCSALVPPYVRQRRLLRGCI